MMEFSIQRDYRYLGGDFGAMATEPFGQMFAKSLANRPALSVFFVTQCRLEWLVTGNQWRVKCGINHSEAGL